jgi:hypothetical protein
MRRLSRFCRGSLVAVCWAFALAVVPLLVLLQLVMFQVPAMERAQNKCLARNPGRMYEDGSRLGSDYDMEGGPAILNAGSRTYTLVEVRQEFWYFGVRCVFEADDPARQPRLVTVGLWTYF